MERISPSKIIMYLRCGEQYRRRYINNEIIPPSIALIKGKSVHRGLQENHIYKKDKQKDLSLKKLLEIIDSNFDENLKGGLLLNKEEETIGKDKVIGDGKDSSIVLGKLYHKEVAPSIMPQYIEEKQVIQTSPEVELVSVLDLADTSKNIIDFKTSTRKKSESEIITDLQLSFQALTYRSITKENPKSVNFCVLVDKAKPEVQNLKGIRDNIDYQIIINYINSFIQGVRNGVFLPSNPANWWCSDKFCGYALTCKFFKGM